MKKLTLMLLSFLIASLQLIQAQGVKITGTTSDGTTGDPLPGVTVQVAETTVGAISQADGTYTISNVPEGSTTLIFSFIGYQTQNVDIAGRTVIDVIMEEEVTALEEIVVTGYSVERKKDIIGSVAVVNTEDMLTTPSGNVTAQIAGRIAGVTTSSDGTLGGASKVRVRGFGSFTSSEPLYIIDGVPAESVDNLNPNDIESMQVLKDAASASVYGARAASGVIIITTRQGKEGPVKVNLDAYYGINYISPNDFPDLLNAEELGELRLKSQQNVGIGPGDGGYGDAQYFDNTESAFTVPDYTLAYNSSGTKLGGTALRLLAASDPPEFAWAVDPENYDYKDHPIFKAGDTDWFDEVYDPAPVINVQLSATGGSERGNYAISLNYFDQKQTSDRYSYYKRYTVRANSTFNIKRIIRLGENMQVFYNEGRNVGRPGSAWTMPALLVPWDEGGNPAGSRAPAICATWDGGNGNSPTSLAWHDRFDKYSTYGIFGNIFAEVTLFNDLVLRSSFGLDFNYRINKNISETVWENAERNGEPNTVTWETDDNSAWTWTNQATYTKTLGSHSIKLLVGTEAINSLSNNTMVNIDGFFIADDVNYNVPDGGVGLNDDIEGSFSSWSLWSIFGRLEYNYKDKYMINGVVRRDGSSRFGENNRFAVFPSAAIGWRISNEPFMQNLYWLTDLKLKASYGIVGNQSGLSPVNAYSTYMGDESYPIGGGTSILPAYFQDRLGNPDAKWEKTASINAGIDATLFTGALTVSLDYFIKKTNDLLVRRSRPLTEPDITQPMMNVGDIENKGIDFSITNRGKIAGQVDYEVTANFSRYKNKVVKYLDDPAQVRLEGGTRMGDVCVTMVGEEISSFYGWKLDGFINDATELADYIASIGGITGNTWIEPRIGGWKLVDQNGDGKVNTADRVIIGSPHPDFTLGLNISLAWKGIDFTTFIFWNQGGDLFNQSRYNCDFNAYQFNRSARMLYESWTPDNHDAKLPQLNNADATSAKFASDYFVEDATYLRVRTLQLGYTIPQNLTSKVQIDRVRLYVQGQNLLTFTKFSGLDPGVSLSGTDTAMGVIHDMTPTPKQILFGINLSF